MGSLIIVAALQAAPATAAAPGGLELAYVRGSELVLSTASAGNTPVTPGTVGSVTAVAWAPNGARLAWLASESGSSPVLWTAKVSVGGGLVDALQVTASGALGAAPDGLGFSADGTQVLVTTGTSTVQVAVDDQGNPTRATFSGAYPDESPQSLDPTRTWVASTEGTAITIQLEDGSARQTVALPSSLTGMRARFSPSGSSLAILAADAGSTALLLAPITVTPAGLSVATPSVIARTTSATVNRILSWSTDGSRVAFDNAASVLAVPISGGSPTTLVSSPSVAFDWRPDYRPAGVARIAGRDRYATSVATSAALWEDGGAGAVVLASGTQFADALSGVPLAARLDAPLLITRPDRLEPQVATEIRRVLRSGQTVYLLGGTGALSAAVDASVTAMGYATVRYSGKTRFDTALAVARSPFLTSSSAVIVANGLDYPDALTAGAAAGANDGVIVLTSGAVMPSAVSSYLSGLPSTTAVVAVGGSAAKAAGSVPGLSLTPLVGKDRYETSLLVATVFFGPSAAAGIASGAGFPDALGGGAALAALQGPLLLSQATELSDQTGYYLSVSNTALLDVLVFGGTGVLSDAVVQGVQAAVG